MRTASLHPDRRHARRHLADASGGQPDPVGSGGYGDGVYNSDDPYGWPPDITVIAALDKVPSWYSLDNFGTILYAMTSADGRLLKWDPAVGGAAVLQAADSGRGPVPKGRGFVITNERYMMIFATGSDGTVDGGKQNRFAGAIRRIRARGTTPTSPAKRAFSTSSRRVRSSPRRSRATA